MKNEMPWRHLYSASVTNLLAGCWGFIAIHSVLRSLLVTHETLPCLAAPIPILIVWATLERKRWGRLALLGVSVTALGLFIGTVGYAVCSGVAGAWREALNYGLHVLRHYLPDLATSLAVLFLALITGCWLRRSPVIAEFERGKRSALAGAQQAIATSLVLFWGLTVLIAPLASSARINPMHGISGLVSHQHRAANRTTRSAVASNKR